MAVVLNSHSDSFGLSIKSSSMSSEYSKHSGSFLSAILENTQGDKDLLNV